MNGVGGDCVGLRLSGLGEVLLRFLGIMTKKMAAIGRREGEDHVRGNDAKKSLYASSLRL